MPDQQSLSLLWQLFATTQRVKTLLNEVMIEAPLSADEYAVYSVLADEGPLSPKRMAQRLGMPPTTMSHYVRDLAKRRHAKRYRDPLDGRSYKLTLTDAGKQAHRQAARAFDEANRRFRAALESDEAILRKALLEVGRAADQAIRELAIPEVA